MPTETTIPDVQSGDVIDTCIEINRLIQEAPHHARKNGGGTDMTWVARQLGWTRAQLVEFMHTYESLLSVDGAVITPSQTVELPPTESEILSGVVRAQVPTVEEITQAIQKADSNLARGLRSIGLTDTEAEEAEALQQFNQENFRESMDMVSANVLRTSLKLAIQQRIIEGRLKVVRETMESYGPIVSQERDAWVNEESLLVRHYVEIGELLNKIQDTWYKGSAALAVIKMRIRDNMTGVRTQRTNKPGFRPTQIDVAENSE